MTSSPVVPEVFILTWCGDPDALYGSLLTFKTLRVGFPTAQVTVVENASIPEARVAIRAAAAGAGARLIQLEREIPHEVFLAETVARHPHGPLVFLDPDLAFWAPVENWGIQDCLVAGRYIPNFADAYTETFTHERLHTSFLWIPDVARVREFASQQMARRFGWDPLRPLTALVDGVWERWDTAAQLYAAARGAMRAFSEAQLDAYDHLFVGSHVKRVAEKLPPEPRARLLEMHARVRAGDLDWLRGVWREQESFFAGFPKTNS